MMGRRASEISSLKTASILSSTRSKKAVRHVCPGTQYLKSGFNDDRQEMRDYQGMLALVACLRRDFRPHPAHCSLSSSVWMLR